MGYPVYTPGRIDASGVTSSTCQVRGHQARGAAMEDGRASDPLWPEFDVDETLGMGSSAGLRVRLDHGPCIFGEMVGQIVQSASGGELLANLRHGRIAGVAT